MPTPTPSSPNAPSGPLTSAQPAARSGVLLTGWLFGLSSTFASALVTPLVRGAIVGGMDPSTMLLLRLTLATALIGTTMLLRTRGYLQLDRRGAVLMLLIGLLAGVEICAFFWALAYVDAATTSILKSVQPLVVLLLLALRGERLTPRNWARLGLSMAGIYLLVGLGGTVAPTGLILLSASLLLYALQLVLVQWWLHPYNTWTTTFYLTAIMTVVIWVWWGIQGAPWTPPTPIEWLVIVVLAVVSTYFARLALFAAIARIGSGQMALLWPLQTLTAIVLSVIFLQERLAPLQWVGGLLVLGSTLLAVPGRSWTRFTTRPALPR